VGDVLAEGTGDPRGVVVRAHVVQRAGAPKELVQLNARLLVCKAHMVLVPQPDDDAPPRWRMPIEAAGALPRVGDIELHNFVVDRRAPICVEGVVLTSIGTFCAGTTDGGAPSVHQIWNSETIVDLMRLHPTWPAVTLRGDSPFVTLLKTETAVRRVLDGDLSTVKAALRLERSEGEVGLRN